MYLIGKGVTRHSLALSYSSSRPLTGRIGGTRYKKGIEDGSLHGKVHTFLLVLVSEADLQYFRTYFFHPSETDGSHDFF